MGADVRLIGPTEVGEACHCGPALIKKCCRLASKVGAHSQNAVSWRDTVEGSPHKRGCAHATVSSVVWEEDDPVMLAIFDCMADERAIPRRDGGRDA